MASIIVEYSLLLLKKLSIDVSWLRHDRIAHVTSDGCAAGTISERFMDKISGGVMVAMVSVSIIMDKVLGVDVVVSKVIGQIPQHIHQIVPGV